MMREFARAMPHYRVRALPADDDFDAR